MRNAPFPDALAYGKCWAPRVLPLADRNLGHLLDPLSIVWLAYGRRAVSPALEHNVMKRQHEVDAARASIKRLLASRGSQLVSGDRLRKELRKLEEAMKVGNSKRLVRIIGEISRLVCDECLKKQ
jgi:hypothetical protein